MISPAGPPTLRCVAEDGFMEHSRSIRPKKWLILHLAFEAGGGVTGMRFLGAVIAWAALRYQD
jgi:hypothetical protein